MVAVMVNGVYTTKRHLSPFAHRYSWHNEDRERERERPTGHRISETEAHISVTIRFRSSLILPFSALAVMFVVELKTEQSV